MLNVLLFNGLKTRLKENLYLFVDTLPLQEQVSRTFKLPAHVLPIPHTGISHAMIRPSSSEKKSADNKAIRCWWPGRPYEYRGLNIIQQWFERKSGSGCNIELFVARDATLSATSKEITIIALPEVLDREKYLELFYSVDIILLPYDEARYQRSSSGVFVEAIVHDRPVLTTAETWMGSELRRFGLSEWCFDPSETHDLFTLLRAALQVAHSDPRRRAIVKFHREFHSEVTYAKILASFI